MHISKVTKEELAAQVALLKADLVASDNEHDSLNDALEEANQKCAELAEKLQKADDLIEALFDDRGSYLDTIYSLPWIVRRLFLGKEWAE